MGELGDPAYYLVWTSYDSSGVDRYDTEEELRRALEPKHWGRGYGPVAVFRGERLDWNLVPGGDTVKEIIPFPRCACGAELSDHDVLRQEPCGACRRRAAEAEDAA